MARRNEEETKRQPIERVTPSLEQGLNDAQVRLRVENGYTNEVQTEDPHAIRSIIVSNVFTYFNMLFVFLAICLVLVGSFVNLTFLGVVIINTVIGIIQEIRAKKVIDELNVVSVPQSTVVRNGTRQTIPSDQLVLDDLIVLGMGQQIPADAVILNGQVQVNESLITGESDEVIKHIGDSLYSGSFVMSGYCIAILTQVGEDAFASKLTREAKQKKSMAKSEMMNSLTKLIQIIGILVIPLGLLIFYRTWQVLGNTLKDSVVSTVASLIGMIPEGLYLLTSLALVMSVMRLAQKRTLVHDMGCIETLSRVDTLCVDKTGTITEPTMKVTDLKVISRDEDEHSIRHLLGTVTSAFSAENSTMTALKREFDIHSPRRPVSLIPFSSVTKCSAVFFENEEKYFLGAPEFLMPNMDEELASICNQYAMEGKRVMLLERSMEPYHGSLPHHPEPLAVIALMNPIRKQSRTTFRFFTEQGVNIKVISGDNPVTASRIAEQAGIPNADQYVDASALLHDEDLDEACERYTVFGRVSPEQKQKLVLALQARQHTVAMTGDGVNDLLALKTADCSIAMASGADAACQVSQLVLLDSNFESMPSIVAEGRRVVNNIERAAALYLVKNIFSFFMAFIILFAPFTYPITPVQLSLISAVTIGIPSFFLALEPNENRVSGHFLSNVIYRAMPAGLTDLFCIAGTMLFASAFTIADDQAATICMCLMAFVGFLMLVEVCHPVDWRHGILIGLMAAAFILGVTVFNFYFGTVRLNMGSLLVLIVFMLLAVPCMHRIAWAMSHGAQIWRGKIRPGLKKPKKKTK